MIPLRIDAIIAKSGKLIPLSPDLLAEWLKHNAGTEVQITIGKRTKAKSQQQLGYLFAHVIPAISDYTGYSDDEVYGIMKKRFLTRNEGQETEYVDSLSALNMADTSTFIQQVVEFGLNLGAEIYPSEHYGG